MEDTVVRLKSSLNGHAPLPGRGSSSPLIERLVAVSRDSALEEMASGISHELNQPLGAIVTFAQVGERILNQPDGSIEQAREIFQLISKEALAAAEGIRRMRRLFHRDAMERTPCAMGEVVAELRDALSLVADNLGVGLSIRVAGDLPDVNIDRLRIQHVLFTLVQNAIDACSAHDGESAVSIDVGGDRYGVEIAITDTGAGITPADRSQIFHPFFTTKRQGTGLGLASARAVVEAHEGSIGFDAEPGRPTRFWFRIPADSQ